MCTNTSFVIHAYPISERFDSIAFNYQPCDMHAYDW